MNILNQGEIISLMDQLALPENERVIAWDKVDQEQAGYFDRITKIIPHAAFAELKGEIEKFFLSACKNGDYNNPNFDQFLEDTRGVKKLLMRNKQLEAPQDRKLLFFRGSQVGGAIDAIRSLANTTKIKST